MGAWLERSRGSLRFPRGLEARYQAEHAELRAAELRALSVKGAALFFVFGLFINIALVEDATRWIGLAATVICPPIIIMIGKWLIGPELTPFARESRVLVVIVAMSIPPIWQSALSSPANVVPLLFLVVAAILGMLFFARMPFAYSAVYISFSIAAIALASYSRVEAVGTLWRLPPSGLFISGIIALHALRDLERASRQVYLHRLWQSLRIDDLADQNRTLDLLSMTDALTGTGNRREFDRMLEAARPLDSQAHYLLIVDIDHFKRVNDNFGHPGGDACLKMVATAIRASLRERDRLARVGGDEFAVLLADIDEPDAHRLAHRLCAEIASRRLEFSNTQLGVTVTIGGCPWTAERSGEEVFSTADEALYQAKRADRRGVFLAKAAVGS